MRVIKIGRDGHVFKITSDDSSAANYYNGVESFSFAAGAIRLARAATASLPDNLQGLLAYDTDDDVVKVNTGAGWVAIESADDDAIHDNVAAEISAITEKSTPVNADLVIIEDSADSNNKKRVQVGNLPSASAGGSSDIEFDSGQGIDFSDNPGTSATGATTTSDILDWYEKGTWTPKLWDSSRSSSESQTYAANAGSFVRIGDLCYIEGVITMSSLGTLTTSDPSYIADIPFTPANQTGSVSVGQADNISITANQSLTGIVDTLVGNPVIRLRVWDAALGESSLTIAGITASGSIRFSACYIV